MTWLICYFTELWLYWTVTLLICYFTELLLYWTVTLLNCYFTELLLYWTVTLLICYFTELLAFLKVRNSEVSHPNFLWQLHNHDLIDSTFTHPKVRWWIHPNPHPHPPCTRLQSWKVDIPWPDPLASARPRLFLKSRSTQPGPSKDSQTYGVDSRSFAAKKKRTGNNLEGKISGWLWCVYVYDVYDVCMYTQHVKSKCVCILCEFDNLSAKTIWTYLWYSNHMMY